MLEQLNDVQREAVLTTEGPVLIVAGAGSGKTRVITARIHHLMHNGVLPHQILAVTFTNKAAQEMKTRVLEGMDWGRADLNISTFHAFGARFLRSEIGFLERKKDFAIFDSQDQATAFKRVIREMDLKEKDYPPNALRNKFSYLRNTKGDDFELTSPVEREIFNRYRKSLLDQNAVDFDDLLILTVKILRDFPDECGQHWRHRFKYIMVDEYQDTNKIQLRLIRMLVDDHNNICVVGDEDQSIYAWRGAQIQNILEFENHYPGTRIFKLEQNYRSTQTILDFAHKVISQNKMRKPKKLWTEKKEGPDILVQAHGHNRDEAEFVARTVLQAKGNGHPLNEIAVLFRSNFLSRSLEDAFRRLQIPYKLVGGLKFYDRREIKDLLAFMRIVVNPRDWVSFNRTISTPPRGVGAKSFDKLTQLFNMGFTIPEVLEEALRDNILGKRQLRGLKDFLGLYRMLEQSSKEDLPSAWMEKLITELEYFDYLEKEDQFTAEGRVDNVKELLGEILALEQKGMRKLAEFMDYSALISDQDEVEEGVDMVNLMTVHAAKGLEFKRVYVIGLEEGIFPNSRAEAEGESGREEERRLFYVAATRAKEELILTYSRFRQTYGNTSLNNPSPFLIVLKPSAEERRAAKATLFPEKKVQKPFQGLSKEEQNKRNLEILKRKGFKADFLSKFEA